MGVRNAVARLSETLPPVGPELAQWIAGCVSAHNLGETSGVSKFLGQIQVGLRAPIDEPDTNLAQMPELLAILSEQLAASQFRLTHTLAHMLVTHPIYGTHS